MNIWFGYSGLTIAFLIISTVMLWIIIQTKGKILTKAIIIPMVIWYSLVLFNAGPNLMGWPSPRVMPIGSEILTYIIKEPQAPQKGAFYFWVIPPEEKSWIDKISPDYFMPGEPKSYKIPYDRELHKRLLEAQKKKQERRGSKMYFFGFGDGTETEEERKNPGSPGFKVRSPVNNLVK
jgi:hypothetical protein